MLIHGRYDELSDYLRMNLEHIGEDYLKLNEMPDDPLSPYYYHVYYDTLPLEYHYRIIP